MSDPTKDGTGTTARAAAQRRGRAKLAAERDRASAYAAWAQGRLVPHRITLALDICELYGPEVDQQCGVEEPAVDRWEAGELYPTWEQVIKLSWLTGFDPKFFAAPVEPGHPIRVQDTSLWFHLPEDQKVPDFDPVLRFTPEAIRATLGHDGRPAPGTGPAGLAGPRMQREIQELRRRAHVAGNHVADLERIAEEIESANLPIQARKLRAATGRLRHALEGTR